MNNRERLSAVLHYQPYDRLPIAHFGFWNETLSKWADEGHIERKLVGEWRDGNTADVEIGKTIGFDFNYYSAVHPNSELAPGFVGKVIKELPDGSRHEMNCDGVIVLHSSDAGSIPSEIEHTLVDRKSWEEQYRFRYQWDINRVTSSMVMVSPECRLRWDDGGLEFLRSGKRDFPLGFYCGSLFGHFRNVAGVVGASYMQLDDPELFREILDNIGDLCYRNLAYALKQGAKFDFIHFWEDICYKNGPLVDPQVFAEHCGPTYRRIASLAREYGVDIASLDCDGMIDALLPTWVENGINTMFPIEVGTWDANIAPWRQKYGRELRGVGGMNKVVFSRDHAAVDAEVVRLKPLVELGGYIPCPDHRIPPDAKFELVQYYCRRMKEEFA